MKLTDLQEARYNAPKWVDWVYKAVDAFERGIYTSELQTDHYLTKEEASQAHQQLKQEFGPPNRTEDLTFFHSESYWDLDLPTEQAYSVGVIAMITDRWYIRVMPYTTRDW
jgi:hypothetical protein